MSPILGFFLFVLAVCAVGAIALVIVVKRKIRHGVAWAEVKLLDAAVKELQEKKEKATAPDQDLDDLLGRTESAHNQAKAALEKGDYKAVLAVASPVLKELAERVQKAAEAAQVKPVEYQDGQPESTTEGGAHKLLPPPLESSAKAEAEQKK